MVVHSSSERSTSRECWNCKYWDPQRRNVRSNGSVEESSPGTCMCKNGTRYGQKQGNMASCGRFEKWLG